LSKATGRAASVLVLVVCGLHCGGPNGQPAHAAAGNSDAKGTGLSIATITGQDWPTRLHDIQRTGLTAEQLSLPLTRTWTYRTERGPSPAWTESPAKHDYLHNWYDLKPRQSFDRCFDVAAAGNHVYFGSSTSGAVTCLDAATGEEAWTFFTSGPVRFAPHVADGKVYVGSDDGYAYCLRAEDGSMIWRERAGPADDMIWGNEHMISVWPVRTSVMYDAGEVFWTAGIFPEEGMYVCKRNAADGSDGWTQPAVAPPQGYLLGLPDRVFVPTGKSYPRMYSRATGSCVGDIKENARDGGCWALIAPGLDEFWFGPTTSNETQAFRMSGLARIASVPDANCLIVDATHAYYNTDNEIVKIDRSSRENVWRKPHGYMHALIKAGATLFVGGDGEVGALNTDGQCIWTAAVDGNAYGLAVAQGRLYVSTDTGSIHCFRATVPKVGDELVATHVTRQSAELHGVLAAHGADAAQVTLFWGESDGGTEPALWPHSRELGTPAVGPVEASVTGLVADRTYYFRLCARNSAGVAWSPRAGTFITGAVTIRAARATVSEQGRRHGLLTVSRPASAAGEALTVRYSVSGVATPGTDFDALSGTVVIPEGEADAAIHIRAKDDLPLNEADETVEVALEPGPYVLGPARSAAVTIEDRLRLTDWGHRMKIRFPGCESNEVLVDFPALIVLDASIEGFDYAQFGWVDGADLRFTDEACTRFLNYEVEQWDPNGRSLVWVQIPELKGAEAAIWAFWGNRGASAPDYARGGGAWSNGYVGVWHLGEPDGTLADSAGSENHGTPEGGVAQGAAGIIANAVGLSGSGAHITLTSPLSIGDTDNAVSVWFKAPLVGTGGLAEGERVGIVLGNFRDTPNSNWEVHAEGGMRTFWNGGQIDQFGATDLREAQWHLLSWVRDKEAHRSLMYIDGRLEKVIETAGADIVFKSTHRFGGDNRPGGSPWLHGSLDEMRVSNVARSPDWLRACWKNQSHPDRFVAYDPVGHDAERDASASHP